MFVHLDKNSRLGFLRCTAPLCDLSPCGHRLLCSPLSLLSGFLWTPCPYFIGFCSTSFADMLSLHAFLLRQSPEKEREYLSLFYIHVCFEPTLFRTLIKGVVDDKTSILINVERWYICSQSKIPFWICFRREIWFVQSSLEMSAEFKRNGCINSGVWGA